MSHSSFVSVNVASRLAEVARSQPGAVAVAEPLATVTAGRRDYRTICFADLEADSSRVAAGLRAQGVTPGTRVALLVRPGIDFVSLVFACLKCGAVAILIDPGMGRKNLVRCLDEARPEGFVAISAAHAVRAVLRLARRRFLAARINVTVGRRWFWGGPTLEELRRDFAPEFESFVPRPDDPAAIIFTSGSTGPPKGVLYRHQNFDRQVEEIRGRYEIEPGGIDLACFPLFGLFNSVWGVTTVVPDMDASRPASVDPRQIVAAIHDWSVTQSFASPAVWNRVGAYCAERKLSLPTLRRVYSAGAPVAAPVLRAMQSCIATDGEIYTPYGATEALPVASISATEVLEQTWPETERGAGVCVGTRFPGIEWRVIAINDGPIETLSQAKPLPAGEIGELIVRGPVVTSEYGTRVEFNLKAKVADPAGPWHRLGDVGYLDARQRFWFCGRLSQRVRIRGKTLFTIPCESVFNTHPEVFRSALIGIGRPGSQQPAVFVETQSHKLPPNQREHNRLVLELQALADKYAHTRGIKIFFFLREMPVDVRHNAKIRREELAARAAKIKANVEWAS
ncbi:MAG TPA: fatty acid CoA ligase family protein [Pirellulales bacterium]|nr:fatty acid CoA ligase family protein [Pirellulales bacterium]